MIYVHTCCTFLHSPAPRSFRTWPIPVPEQERTMLFHVSSINIRPTISQPKRIHLEISRANDNDFDTLLAIDNSIATVAKKVDSTQRIC